MTMFENKNLKKLLVSFNENENGDPKIEGILMGGQEVVQELYASYPKKTEGNIGEDKTTLVIEVTAPFLIGASSTPTEDGVTPYTTFGFGAKGMKVVGSASHGDTGAAENNQEGGNQPAHTSNDERYARLESELEVAKRNNESHTANNTELNTRAENAETENNQLKTENADLKRQVEDLTNQLEEATAPKNENQV